MNKILTQEQINEKLALHQLWLKSFNTEGQYANFYQCDLSYADLSNFNLSEVNFEECNLTHTKMKNCKLHKTSFKHCQAQLINFENSSFINPGLLDNDFSYGNFQNTRLHCVDFYYCDLTYANFENTHLLKTDFQYSTTYNIILPKNSYIIDGGEFRVEILNGKRVRVCGFDYSVEELKNLTSQDIVKFFNSKMIMFYPKLLKLLDVLIEE